YEDSGTRGTRPTLRLRVSASPRLDCSPLFRCLGVPDGEHIGRALAANTVVRKYLVGGGHRFSTRKHQRLAAAQIELDGDEFLLRIAQHLHEVLEILDRSAIDGFHDLRRWIRIALGKPVRKER